tara:strand:+ start:219 stop:968 length:750 start_codon:yes stop_codon:yes gene_type:complete
MNYLFFGLDGSDNTVMFIEDAFLGGFPTSDTNLRLFFEGAVNANLPGTNAYIINLTIGANRHKEVLSSIYDAILTSENAMIVVADDDNSIYIDSNITAVESTQESSFSYSIGYNGYSTLIKVLPRDFQPADNGRPVMFEDTSIGSNELFLFSDGANDMYASIDVPFGFKATHVQVYGSDTGQNFHVYSASVLNKTITDIGTGATAIESQCTLATEFVASESNYMIIRVTSDGSSDEIHGGRITIERNLT